MEHFPGLYLKIYTTFEIIVRFVNDSITLCNKSCKWISYSIFIKKTHHIPALVKIIIIILLFIQLCYYNNL